MSIIKKHLAEQREQMIKQSLDYIVKDGKLYDLEGTYIGDQFHHEWLSPVKQIRKGNKKNYSKFNKAAIDEHCRDNGGFIFALFKRNKDILERFTNLNKKDIARLLFIATYTHYETGRLQKADGTRITKESFPELVKMSDRYGKQLLNKFIDEDILHIHDQGSIYINNDYFTKGTPVITNTDTGYVRLFIKTVRDLFHSAKENELAHVATIYATLPYINLYYNIICHNPNETDINAIVPMHTDELAEKLGYNSYNKLTAQLNKLKINNLPVFNYFTDVDDKRKKNIVVNPSVVYSGNNKEQLEVVKGMFVAGGIKSKK